MGSYGIGPGRVLAAAVEQHNDEKGIIWPRELAPYDVHIIALAHGNEEILRLATELGESVAAEGMDVLLDDRELRPGEKFADADLIGCPIRLTVGKRTLEDGAADLRVRETGEDERIGRLEVAKRVLGR